MLLQDAVTRTLRIRHHAVSIPTGAQAGLPVTQLDIVEDAGTSPEATPPH